MFIDANIFIEIFLKDKNYKRCEEFIKDLLKKNTQFYTSDFILYSCLLIIHNKSNSIQNLKNFLIFINSIKINIIRPSLRAIYESFKLMEKYKLDFDDSLVLSSMLRNGIKKLVSYDKDFEKINEISIIRP